MVGSAEARYRALIRHLPDTIVALLDRDLLGVSIDGPRVAEANFPGEAFEGMPLNAAMPAADFERLEPHYRAALSGEPSSHELTPLENGTVYQVEIIPFRPHRTATWRASSSSRGTSPSASTPRPRRSSAPRSRQPWRRSASLRSRARRSPA